MKSMYLQKIIVRKPLSTLQKWHNKELSFLQETLLHDLIYVSTHYFQIITKSMGAMACSRFSLHGTQVHNEVSCLPCMWGLQVLISVSTKYHFFFPNNKKLRNGQELGLVICSGEITRRWPKQELFFLHAILLLDQIYVPTNYYQIISNSTKLWHAEDFGFRGN